MSRRSFMGLVFAISLCLVARTSGQQPSSGVVINVGQKWNSFDGYLKEMATAIQSKWRQILIDSKTRPPPGTFVAVKLVMDSAGRIGEILDVGNTSSEPGGQCCLTAITVTAPFKPWSDGMVATLGKSQEVTVRFYY